LIYDLYISGNPHFGHTFDEYEILNNNALNVSETQSLLQKLDKKGLIKGSFLQLNVQFNSSQYIEQKYVRVFPIDAFGAQMGGVLSLWFGLTIILIFEICEAVINLATVGCMSNKEKQVMTKQMGPI